MDNWKPTTWSPWGVVEQCRRIADGIFEVSTASHGGFVVSPTRLKQMPEKYRKLAFRPSMGPYFEEDCAWCAVVLTWPSIFNAADVQAAELAYNHYTQRNSQA